MKRRITETTAAAAEREHKFAADEEAWAKERSALQRRAADTSDELTAAARANEQLEEQRQALEARVEAEVAALQVAEQQVPACRCGDSRAHSLAISLSRVQMGFVAARWLC